MEKVNIGIIGFGNIGSGVVKLLKKNSSLIKERTGIEICTRKIADINFKKNRGIKIDKKILTRDAREIIDDPQIQIVAELIGGIHPAKEFIINSLKKGKSVVTANKALLAQEGQEILKTALENGQDIYFEASVCGGIPIIKTIREAMLANRINYMAGIINGTSNYILSRMEEGLTFKQALIYAQKKGVAEKKPSLDIEGIDAAHKLAILGSLIFDIPLTFKNIYSEGISSLTPMDLKFAKEFGYTVKLLAIAKEDKGNFQFRVNPALISAKHPLATVRDEYNAVYIKGDAVGKMLFYGKGAGQSPTASAVLSDIIDIARNLKFETCGRITPITYYKKSYNVIPIQQLKGLYYLRIMAVDKPGVLAKISNILGEHNISIASVFQKGRNKAEAVPIVMMTHEAKEKDISEAIKKIDKLPAIKGNTVRIRVEE
ncbi:MAG: homoserine dehydrogenase [Candidatus Ratteibacteria bacterium]|nr:homoserine dehydrogenase [Candidatus Ratteibacteria bacterium]